MISNTSKDVLDLLRIKYNQLRELAIQSSNDLNDVPITISEWYILSCIYGEIRTVPEICAELKISKQAANKFIKGLEEKGLVKTYLNKNKKTVQFTELGEKSFKETFVIKKKIDEMIEQNIGTEAFQNLKQLLEKDWV